MNDKQALTLEEGKYYRTRGGKKAFVAGTNPFNDEGMCAVVGFIDGKLGYVSWDRKGAWLSAPGDSFDLVAEWVEPKRIKGFLAIGQRVTGDIKGTHAEAVQEFAKYGDVSNIRAVIEVDVLEGHGLGEAA